MAGVGARLVRVLLAVALAGAAFVAPMRLSRASAFAVCDDPPDDGTSLLSIISPAPGPMGYGGPPPLTLTIQIAEGLAIFPTNEITSSFFWGDGTSSAIQALPCPDGESAYWPSQTVGHTYRSPGTYATTWRISGLGQTYDLPFIVVVVAEVAPTPAPEPPTPTPTPPPTAQPTSVPTASAGATEVATPAASPSVTAATTTSTATATATATRTPTPVPSTAVVAPGAVTGTPSASPPAAAGEVTVTANEQYRSRTFLPLEEIDDVSRDPDVVATNLVIAGVTVWVLFSSVMLNQVLQANRDDIDRKTQRLTRPLRRLRPPRPSTAYAWLPGWAQRLLVPSAVLAITGLLYAVVEPDFGWNEHTVVLFGSAVFGVGLVTYLCAGMEAVATKRWIGAEAAVRPFPACIAIAAASVAISRLLDLQPGVMYGFVASCAVAAPVAASAPQGGRVALAPVTAALAVAVGAWLLVGPIRDLNESPGGWFPALLEATVIIVFIGGIEGTVLSMLPLPETDGGKIYRWHRWLWFAIALAAAFLTWHVLLGRERSYFSGLREAGSMTVFIMFIVYTALTIGLWSYFRLRKRSLPEAAAGPAPAG